ETNFHGDHSAGEPAEKIQCDRARDPEQVAALVHDRGRPATVDSDYPELSTRGKRARTAELAPRRERDPSPVRRPGDLSNFSERVGQRDGAACSSSQETHELKPVLLAGRADDDRGIRPRVEWRKVVEYLPCRAATARDQVGR